MNKLGIRPATLEDQGVLFSLHEELFRDQIDQIWGWDDRWQLENFQREWHEVETLIIHEQGKFAGCMQTRDEPDHVYVMNLAIHPEFQNRGIGSEMIRWLQQRNMVIRLSVFRTNERVLPWYCRCGFRVVEKTGTGFKLEWRPAAT
jgi:ribosomal protein S18 acetylase RimI-like enzyme